jgi:hypothetical protein
MAGAEAATVVAVVSVGDGSVAARSTAVAFVAAVLVAAIGVATGAIIDSPTMSSSAASAIRGRLIRMDITGTAMAIIHMITIRTVIMALDTAGTDPTVAPVTDTAMAAGVTCAVTFLIQRAQCLASRNHGVT